MELARALNARRIGKRWIARCPAHADKRPSLSITEANGKVLVYCFAGCTQDSVIAALRERGIWAERAAAPSRLSQANQYAAKLFKIGYAWRIERELEKEKLRLNASPDPQEGEFKGIATLTAALAKCLQWKTYEAYRAMRAIDKRTASSSINEARAFLSHVTAVAK